LGFTALSLETAEDAAAVDGAILVQAEEEEQEDCITEEEEGRHRGGGVVSHADTGDFRSARSDKRSG